MRCNIHNEIENLKIWLDFIIWNDYRKDTEDKK